MSDFFQLDVCSVVNAAFSTHDCSPGGLLTIVLLGIIGILVATLRDRFKNLVQSFSARMIAAYLVAAFCILLILSGVPSARSPYALSIAAACAAVLALVVWWYTQRNSADHAVGHTINLSIWSLPLMLLLGALVAFMVTTVPRSMFLVPSKLPFSEADKFDVATQVFRSIKNPIEDSWANEQVITIWPKEIPDDFKKFHDDIHHQRLSDFGNAFSDYGAPGKVQFSVEPRIHFDGSRSLIIQPAIALFEDGVYQRDEKIITTKGPVEQVELVALIAAYQFSRKFIEKVCAFPLQPEAGCDPKDQVNEVAKVAHIYLARALDRMPGAPLAAGHCDTPECVDNLVTHLQAWLDEQLDDENAVRRGQTQAQAIVSMNNIEPADTQ